MTSASSSSNSAQASSSRSWKYDVFLSFRGEDTRKTFVDHLYSALVERLIRVYKDDEALPRGDSICQSLLKAIEESHIAVIVFSKNYADSSWCLDELAHIMKCRDERGLTVMPIFYDVDPSEVRNQKRKFGEAFAKQEAKNVMNAVFWRKALIEASNIAGWEPKHIANGHESILIKEIVDTIFERLLSSKSDIDEDFIGMMVRFQDFIPQLKIGSGGVHMVGIWGVGGGGKTTLAICVYMEISHHFESHCIVENIREESRKHGLRKLQENILSAVFKRNVKLDSVAEGKRQIKSMLCHINVLVLLDDDDDLCQLEALAGSHSWFGSGSRIIITTRDEHLLRTHKVDKICPVRLLSEDEALQLFHRHSYNIKKPVKDYDRFSTLVVSYAAGLPLALKVLGSFLYDRDEKEWMSTLVRLKDIPEAKVSEQLKISYDGLKSVEKELFLDIACFFRGKSLDDAMEILDACGFHPVIGIQVLIEKALITLSHGMLNMHDLVQEMAHYIVRGEYAMNPEKHSRVWNMEDIRIMCSGDATTENDKIEAIQYYDRDLDSSSRFFKIVSKMKNLRWLCVTGNKYAGEPTFLSNELRYIFWENYPTSPFLDCFQLTKLVVLKLYDSSQKILWQGCKDLPQLKVLELHNMKNLLSAPDFNGLPRLQKLELFFCNALEEIHSSLGNHRSLEYVCVFGCRKLRMFPVIVGMDKLKTLEIKDCYAILDFPEIQAKMENLTKLSLQQTGIEVLPSSVGEHCTNLTSLYLIHCINLKSIEANFDNLKHLKEFKYHCDPYVTMSNSLFDIKQTFKLLQLFSRSLRKLELSGCRLNDGEIPSDIGELSNLQDLDLSANKFHRLDFSLLQLTRLKLLNLSHCKQLVEFPELPSSIAILNADGCVSLIVVGNFHTNCKWLCQVSLVKVKMVIDGRRLLESMLQGKAIENHSMILQLEGLEIPRGFTPSIWDGIIPSLWDGNKCILELPQNWCNDFCGFLICAVLKDVYLWSDISITMKQVRGGSMIMDSHHDVVSLHSCKEMTWVGYVSFGFLRHTAWWNPRYNMVSFLVDIPRIIQSHDGPNKQCKGFGVGLVPRKCGRGPGPIETSTDSIEYSNENDDYTYKFKIVHDSTYALQISSSIKELRMAVGFGFGFG